MSLPVKFLLMVWIVSVGMLLCSCVIDAYRERVSHETKITARLSRW
jgi:hypothetical protein